MSRAVRIALLVLSNSSRYAMQSLSVDPSWGVELSTYMSRWKPLVSPIYDIHTVESAIEMFTLNRPGIISDSTLEAVLSVTYYPTLLKLLVKENLTVVWFCLYIRYRQDHLVSLYP